MILKIGFCSEPFVIPSMALWSANFQPEADIQIILHDSVLKEENLIMQISRNLGEQTRYIIMGASWTTCDSFHVMTGRAL
jgi:hypothetical protein